MDFCMRKNLSLKLNFQVYFLQSWKRMDFFQAVQKNLTKIHFSTLLLNNVNVAESSVEISDPSSCPEKCIHKYPSLRSALHWCLLSGRYLWCTCSPRSQCPPLLLKRIFIAIEVLFSNAEFLLDVRVLQLSPSCAFFNYLDIFLVA